MQSRLPVCALQPFPSRQLLLGADHSKRALRVRLRLPLTFGYRPIGSLIAQQGARLSVSVSPEGRVDAQ